MSFILHSQKMVLRWLVLAAFVAVSYATATIAPSANGGSVLVLGSGGLIGSAVVKWLKANRYNVAEVINREHVDLRVPHSLDRFNSSDIRFVVFLACEVGGSKFIDSKNANTQLQILEHNLQIYQNVFNWMNDRGRIPFLFSSSYLQMLQTAYGSVKRTGEAWINALGFGRMVRLWNVYGLERAGPKSHVITDWIGSCIEQRSIRALTDGHESRQFLHVDDCARAIGTAIQHYDELEPVTDISSNQWITLRQLAETIASHPSAPHHCPATFTDIRAAARARVSPNVDVPFYRHWQAQISLSAGLQQLFEAAANSKASKSKPKSEL